MHIGSYDDEPITIENMHKFVESKNYQIDIKIHAIIMKYI